MLHLLLAANREQGLRGGAPKSTPIKRSLVNTFGGGGGRQASKIFCHQICPTHSKWGEGNGG